MQEVNIFLASSLTELAEDRKDMGDFLYHVTGIYKKRGIFINLFNCDFFNTAIGRRRKQDEYNAEIKKSDIFIALFYAKAGEHTVEEFELAYEQFKRTETPAILLYFKQGEKQPEQNLLEFKEYLEEGLGHYLEYYSHFDTVKLKLLIQFMLMNLDIPVELEDSVVKLGGEEVLSLKNIPMWAKNKSLQTLKAHCEECERAYLKAKVETTNRISDPKYRQAKKKWEQAKEEMQELEQQLFSIALKIAEKNNDNALTERQRKAYELMEQGDSEGAYRILDWCEILEDAEHGEAMIDRGEAIAEQGRRAMEQCVQELLQKIEVLKTQTDKPERFAEIREIFQKAVSWEEHKNLKKVAMREYIWYLTEQNDYRTAISLAEKFLADMEREGAKDDIAYAAGFLGVLYRDTNRMKQAEKEYLRSKEIREHLAEENPAAYLPDLATICNNLGILYSDTNRMEQAENMLLRVKSIYKQFAKNIPEKYMPKLSIVCGVLSEIYEKIGDEEKARAELAQAIEIDSQIFGETLS